MANQIKKYFDYFGLPVTATFDDVKKVYRLMAKRLHPDVNVSKTANDEFVELERKYYFLTSHISNKSNLNNSVFYQSDVKTESKKDIKNWDSIKLRFTKEQQLDIQLAESYLDDKAVNRKIKTKFEKDKMNVIGLKGLRLVLLICIIMITSIPYSIFSWLFFVGWSLGILLISMVIDKAEKQSLKNMNFEKLVRYVQLNRNK